MFLVVLVASECVDLIKHTLIVFFIPITQFPMVLFEPHQGVM